MSLFDALGNSSVSCADNFAANCGDSKNWIFYGLIYVVPRHGAGTILGSEES